VNLKDPTLGREQIDVVLNPYGLSDTLLRSMDWHELRVDLCPVHTTAGNRRYKLTVHDAKVAFVYAPMHMPHDQIVTALEGTHDVLLVRWGAMA
jgi:hypothetical protein